MLRTPKFCFPVICSSVYQLQEKLKTYNSSYDAFEVWVDYLEEFKLEELQELANLYGEKLIFVLRRRKLEPIHLALDLRRAIIEVIGKTSAYLDLDLNTQTGELLFYQTLPKKPKLLLSAHRYDETPADSALRDIIKRMEEYAPSIYKIAAMCRTPDDALRLLRFGLHLRASGKRSIVLGMGEHGVATRIFGTLWSNELIFAPPKGEGLSAPGQLSKDALQTIFQIVKEESGG